jgi:hypothetical protein
MEHAMTRIDRLVVLLCLFLSFVVVFGLWAAIIGSVGPFELLVVLVVAIPLGILLSRFVRKVMHRSGRPA